MKGPLANGPVDGRSPESVFGPGKRRRLNLMAIMINIALPWIGFAASFAVTGFKFRHDYTALAYGFVIAELGFAGIVAFLGFKAAQQRMDPMWYNFFALWFGISVVLGTALGDTCYRTCMGPAYFSMNLNSYADVNPAMEKGQQLMDAGRIYFTEGSGIDMRKAMGFKNFDTYCVAPITTGQDQLPSYDYWAVGINCCSGVSADFRCGEYNNPHANAGLRLLRDDERPFFRLAVQQAEAAYNIRSTHPLFFTWMQDPASEIQKWREDGFKWAALSMMAHFAFDVFLVCCATIGFSKLSRP